MRMGIEESFNRLADGANDFAKLKMNEIKLLCVENLSLFVSEILSMIVVFIISAVSIFFALIAAVTFIASYIGFLNSLLATAALLAIIAFFVYALREELFTDIVVRHLCKIFFRQQNESENEKH